MKRLKRSSKTFLTLKRAFLYCAKASYVYFDFSSCIAWLGKVAETKLKLEFPTSPTKPSFFYSQGLPVTFPITVSFRSFCSSPWKSFFKFTLRLMTSIQTAFLHMIKSLIYVSSFSFLLFSLNVYFAIVIWAHFMISSFTFYYLLSLESTDFYCSRFTIANDERESHQRSQQSLET